MPALCAQLCLERHKPLKVAAHPCGLGTEAPRILVKSSLGRSFVLMPESEGDLGEACI